MVFTHIKNTSIRIDQYLNIFILKTISSDVSRLALVKCAGHWAQLQFLYLTKFVKRGDEPSVLQACIVFFAEDHEMIVCFQTRSQCFYELVATE